MKVQKSLALLHELTPNFRCKCAINHAEFIEQFHDRIDDFTPYIRCLVTEYERLMQYRKDYPGKRFLWYMLLWREPKQLFAHTFIRESYDGYTD